jgi:hypothetical protein
MNWFAQNGDKVITFVGLVALAFQTQSTFPHWVIQAALAGSIVATAAHQSFFPTPPQEPRK